MGLLKSSPYQARKLAACGRAVQTNELGARGPAAKEGNGRDRVSPKLSVLARLMMAEAVSCVYTELAKEMHAAELKRPGLLTDPT